MNYTLTAEDKKIRKNWLLWMVAILFCLPLFDFAFSLFLYSKSMIPLEMLGEPMLRFFLGFISFSITYACAYSSHGTRWIGFLLIISPIKALCSTVQFKELTPAGPWTPVLILGELALFGFIYFLHLQLYRLNKRIQAQVAECKNCACAVHVDQTPV